MPTINVMSWNIKDLGDRKISRNPFSNKRPLNGSGATFAELIAGVALNQNVDLLLVMEVSPSAAAGIATRVTAALNNQQNNPNLVWGSVNSGATGSSSLPIQINLPPAPAPRFKNAQIATNNAAALALCYDQAPTPDAKGNPYWTIKATLPSQQQQQQCINALIAAGAVRRPDQESYLAFFRYDAATPWINSASGITLNQANCALAATDAAGTQLGYQIPGSLICGRWPFLIPLTAGAGAAAVAVPLLVFHGPYLGMFTNYMAIRTDAMTTLMQIGVPSGGNAPVRMGASTAGVICGDFNISYVPGAGAGTDSANSYGVLTGAPNNYIAAIAQANPNPPPPYMGSPSTQGGEAYDNIFYKLPQAQAPQNAAIFDPSGLWAAQTFLGYQSANAANARTAYWKWVSDHLPAVLRVTF